jgi:hypothetical protein
LVVSSKLEIIAWICCICHKLGGNILARFLLQLMVQQQPWLLKENVGLPSIGARWFVTNCGTTKMWNKSYRSYLLNVFFFNSYFVVAASGSFKCTNFYAISPSSFFFTFSTKLVIFCLRAYFCNLISLLWIIYCIFFIFPKFYVSHFVFYITFYCFWLFV